MSWRQRRTNSAQRLTADNSREWYGTTTPYRGWHAMLSCGAWRVWVVEFRHAKVEIRHPLSFNALSYLFRLYSRAIHFHVLTFTISIRLCSLSPLKLSISFTQ